MRKVKIQGLKLHEAGMEATLRCLEAFILKGEPHLVVTLSSEMLITGQKNTEFKEVVNSASLVVADSEGVRYLGCKKGLNLPERVSGIDIVKKFMPLCEEKGYRIFLLGGEPGVAETASRKLKERYPQLKIVGTRHGYFSEPELVAAAIKETDPQLLLIGMGSPRQEIWFHQNMDKLGPAVGIGVGGSLDVLAGKVERAPRFYINLKLEWLYRLLKEPKRFSRVLPLFKLPFMMWFDAGDSPETDENLIEILNEVN